MRDYLTQETNRELIHSSFLLSIASATAYATYKNPDKIVSKLTDQWKNYVTLSFGLAEDIDASENRMKEEYDSIWSKTLVTITKGADGKLIAKMTPDALKTTK